VSIPPVRVPQDALLPEDNETSQTGPRSHGSQTATLPNTSGSFSFDFRWNGPRLLQPVQLLQLTRYEKSIVHVPGGPDAAHGSFLDLVALEMSDGCGKPESAGGNAIVRERPYLAGDRQGCELFVSLTAYETAGNAGTRSCSLFRAAAAMSYQTIRNIGGYQLGGML
jgi:hypothetical protein